MTPSNSLYLYLGLSMKLGRPLEYNPEQTIEIAMHLYWRKGYGDTTLKDILDATGISKSSFYHAFGSKFQLFERCIERYRDRQLGQMMATLKQASSGRSFIENFLYDIEKTANNDNQHGYFVTSTAFEFSECGHYPEVAILISKAKMSFAEVFKLAIIRGQSEHVISEHKDPTELSLFIISNIAGLRTMIKSKVEPRNIRSVITIVLSALD